MNVTKTNAQVPCGFGLDLFRGSDFMGFNLENGTFRCIFLSVVNMRIQKFRYVQSARLVENSTTRYSVNVHLNEKGYC